MTIQHYYKQPRFKQLRAFCKTVQLENISKAADALFLSQPTVSLQIQSLERDLGTQFFERRGPVIKLTPEGQVLYKVAQPLVEGIESLKETFTAHLGKIEMHGARAETAAAFYTRPDAPGLLLDLRFIQHQQAGGSLGNRSVQVIYRGSHHRATH